MAMAWRSCEFECGLKDKQMGALMGAASDVRPHMGTLTQVCLDWRFELRHTSSGAGGRGRIQQGDAYNVYNLSACNCHMLGPLLLFITD